MVTAHQKLKVASSWILTGLQFKHKSSRETFDEFFDFSYNWLVEDATEVEQDYPSCFSEKSGSEYLR